MRRGRAFTLVELLIVVAILALLLSLLAPTMKRAKVLAALAVCKGQMKQITVSLQMYVTDYDRQLPWTQAQANPSTCRVIGYYEKVTGIGSIFLGGFVDDPRVFFCPGSTPREG